MAQVTVYGHKDPLRAKRQILSELIQGALVGELGLPPEKRFQRFVALEDGDFVHPADRTADYTIVEISMFEGRSADRIKALLKALMSGWEKLKLHPNDLEITVFQTPKHCWGIRGKTGDELSLAYKVEV